MNEAGMCTRTLMTLTALRWCGLEHETRKWVSQSGMTIAAPGP
jgi:hypothetical protein